jgi:hypothetical protein
MKIEGENIWGIHWSVTSGLDIIVRTCEACKTPIGITNPNNERTFFTVEIEDTEQGRLLRNYFESEYWTGKCPCCGFKQIVRNLNAS